MLLERSPWREVRQRQYLDQGAHGAAVAVEGIGVASSIVAGAAADGTAGVVRVGAVDIAVLATAIEFLVEVGGWCRCETTFPWQQLVVVPAVVAPVVAVLDGWSGTPLRDDGVHGVGPLRLPR